MTQFTNELKKSVKQYFEMSCTVQNHFFLYIIFQKLTTRKPNYLTLSQSLRSTIAVPRIKNNQTSYKLSIFRCLIKIHFPSVPGHLFQIHRQIITTFLY